MPEYMERCGRDDTNFMQIIEYVSLNKDNGTTETQAAIPNQQEAGVHLYHVLIATATIHAKF
jgi:hypothetical protein